MEELEDFGRKTLYFLIGGATLAAEGITKAMEDWGNQAQTLVDDCVHEGELRYDQWTREQGESSSEPDQANNDYTSSTEIPRAPSETLRQRLMTLVRGDQSLAERLLLQEKQSNPGQTDRWYWEKVIYDLERDLKG